MENEFSRRGFITMTAAASSSVVLTTMPFKDFLLKPDGEEKVYNILRSNFDIGDQDRLMVHDFYLSLSQTNIHREKPSYFNTAMNQKELDEHLEMYVIEEFLVTTNYFAIQQQDETALRFIGEIS